MLPVEPIASSVGSLPTTILPAHGAVFFAASSWPRRGAHAVCAWALPIKGDPEAPRNGNIASRLFRKLQTMGEWRERGQHGNSFCVFDGENGKFLGQHPQKCTLCWGISGEGAAIPAFGNREERVFSPFPLISPHFPKEPGAFRVPYRALQGPRPLLRPDSSVSCFHICSGTNRLDNLKEVNNLRTVPRLIILDLSGNPLCKDKDYRLYSIYHLKKLKVLDGVSIDTQESLKAKETFTGKMSPELLLERCAWAASVPPAPLFTHTRRPLNTHWTVHQHSSDFHAVCRFLLSSSP